LSEVQDVWGRMRIPIPCPLRPVPCAFSQSEACMAKIMVTVKYLGTFSQLTGRKEELLELEAGATIDALARKLVLKYGRELKNRLEDQTTRPVLFVVTNQPADGGRRLSDGDEVLLTYPAGGG
jgi:molybdopterin converting factor small subunit